MNGFPWGAFLGMKLAHDNEERQRRGEPIVSAGDVIVKMCALYLGAIILFWVGCLLILGVAYVWTTPWLKLFILGAFVVGLRWRKRNQR
jgi:hypothetical protein